MASFKLDTYELSARALSLLRTAISHARLHPSAEAHAVPLFDFYRAARFPMDMPKLALLGLIEEVERVSVFSSDFEPGSLRGWLACQEITLAEAHLEFRLCPYALEATEPAEMPTAEMMQLNQALTVAVAHAAGDAEVFAFHFAAALDGWMTHSMLDKVVAMESIQLMRRLHPNIST